MPGFRHCHWCRGRGCIACDAEEKKWNEARDREYAARFPNGPEPDFVARRDNPDDMQLLATFAHADVLRQIYANGRTPEADAELARRIDEARLIPAARKILSPNEQDANDQEAQS